MVNECKPPPGTPDGTTVCHHDGRIDGRIVAGQIALVCAKCGASSRPYGNAINALRLGKISLKPQHRGAAP